MPFLQGFTFDLKTAKTPKNGYVAAFEETQNCFGFKGFIRALGHAFRHDGCLGGWYNHDNGKFYFDSVKIFKNQSDALLFGQQNKQIAIFDLNTFNEISC